MKSSTHCSSGRDRQGFTLIELLIVVLILSILMAVAMPLYLSSVNDSQKKTCRANMQTIANAVQSVRVESDAINYNAIISSCASSVSTAALPDLQNIPRCPDGGDYSLSAGIVTGGFAVECSYGNHGSFEPGVNNN